MNPNSILSKNLVSIAKSTVPSSKSKYANNPIIIAAKGAPGIPNSTVGIIEVAFCALLAPSGPITPLILPLPNGTSGFLVVATA